MRFSYIVMQMKITVFDIFYVTGVADSLQYKTHNNEKKPKQWMPKSSQAR